MADRVRDYRFTMFNYTDEKIDKLISLKTDYIVWGYEVAPTTGKPHLQGYMYLTSACTPSAIRKKFPGTDIDRCNGTADDNRRYCLKLDTPTPNEKFYEFGTCPVGQGTRTDINDMKKVIDDTKGGPRTKLLACFNANFGVTCRSYRGFQVYIDLTAPKRTVKPEVFWIWGDAGVGKSKWVYSKFESVFNKPIEWYDTYDNEECFLINDFDGSTIGTKELLNLLDWYPFLGKVKGSFVSVVSPVIVVTCDRPPSCFWKAGNELKQVTRRIDHIIHREEVERIC